MNRPPACNLKSGPDGKLKSNLEWPNTDFVFITKKSSDDISVNKLDEILALSSYQIPPTVIIIKIIMKTLLIEHL